MDYVMPLKNEQPCFSRYKHVARILSREPALEKAGGDTEMVQRPDGSLVPFTSLVIRTTNALHQAGRDPGRVSSADIIEQAAVLAKLVKPGKEEKTDSKPAPKTLPKAKGAVVSAVPARNRKPLVPKPEPAKPEPEQKAEPEAATNGAKPVPKAEVDAAPGPAKRRLEKRPTDVAIAIYALLANAHELAERHDKPVHDLPEVIGYADALKGLEKISQRYKKLSQVVPGAA